ncbi:MAG: phosphatidylinositol kinase [Pseudomonadota bacterium]
MYPIIQIPANASSQLEQLGTKAKEWYWDEHNQKVLFKEGRPGTGENWAEKVCCEICRAIDIPHAEYELATWGKREGVISPIFVPADGRLIHGNELLAKIHEDYDETRTYRSSQHTVRRVLAALSLFAPLPPIGWQIPPQIDDAAGVFLGYLMLDALVGNQDRHHENWGLINSLEYGVRLAPTFDHASSLGRNESDEARKERLTSKDRGRGIEYYCRRARSGLYKTVLDSAPLDTVAAFQEAAKIRPPASRYWLGRLENVEISSFERILAEVPDRVITATARLFALKMLEVNRNRLLKLVEQGI